MKVGWEWQWLWTTSVARPSHICCLPDVSNLIERITRLICCCMHLVFPVRSTASKRHASPISICGWFKTKTHLRTQFQLVKTTHLTKLRTCCDASNIPSEDTARCAEDACTQDRAHYQVVQLVYVHQCQRYLLSQKLSLWDAPALFLYRFVYIALHVVCMYDDR